MAGSPRVCLRPTQGYCRTALLSHPTTRRRLADAAAMLEAGSSLPMALVTPLSEQLVLQPGILAGARAA